MVNVMTQSMTGYASGKGAHGAFNWSWDIRSVNARGLDIRLRIPDWVDGLEPRIREVIRANVARGSMTVSLKLSKDAGAASLEVSPDSVDAALAVLDAIARRANETGSGPLTPPTALDILELCRGATSTDLDDNATAELAQAILSTLPGVMTAFTRSRAMEGEKLHAILSDQVEQIEALVSEAGARAKDREADMKEALRTNLARVQENADGVDEARLAQELALLAVKSDVTEEIDRLQAHIATARELLASKGPVGRKLDFLTQEFNREANTLCSKAQFKALTAVGLDLKAVIDQMREQVQNVE